MPQIDNRTWWTIEFAEMLSFETPEFEDDVDMLHYLEKVRALNDPSIKPVAVLKHEQMVSTEVQRFPLGGDSKKVAELVRQKFIEEFKGQSHTGEDALDWAVKATMEVLRNE